MHGGHYPSFLLLAISSCCLTMQHSTELTHSSDVAFYCIASFSLSKVFFFVKYILSFIISHFSFSEALLCVMISTYTLNFDI